MINIKKLRAQVLSKDVCKDQMAYKFKVYEINLKFYLVLSLKFHRYTLPWFIIIFSNGIDCILFIIW